MDGRIPTIAAAAGYPVGTMPLGYSETNGRPFGMCIVAAAENEDKILQAMKSWDATIPKRKAPAQVPSRRVALRAAPERDGLLMSILKAIRLSFASLMQSMRKHAAAQLTPRQYRPHWRWESGLKLPNRFKGRRGTRKVGNISTPESSWSEFSLGQKSKCEL